MKMMFHIRYIGRKEVKERCNILLLVEAKSKNCVVIYSFTVIVLHRAMLENHCAL